MCCQPTRCLLFRLVVGWITWQLLGIGGRAEVYHFGLDFIETATTIYGCPHDPFPMLADGTHFANDGGAAGLSEADLQRRIAIATEVPFRAIQTGNPQETLAVFIHVGRVPDDVVGRRLNVLMGKKLPAGTLPIEVCIPEFGHATPNSYRSAQDTNVAAVYLNYIDEFVGGAVPLDTTSKISFAVGGTTAHEIGHVFGADHVPAVGPPYPLMAVGIPLSVRVGPRYFSTTVPQGNPNAARVLRAAGTVPIGDLNFDGAIDAADAAIIFANWQLPNRLTQEGNLNSDEVVDGADAAILFAGWSGDAAPAGLLSIPEPSCATLIGAAALALWLRGRQQVVRRP